MHMYSYDAHMVLLWLMCGMLYGRRVRASVGGGISMALLSHLLALHFPCHALMAFGECLLSGSQGCLHCLWRHLSPEMDSVLLRKWRRTRRWAG